MWDLPKNFCYYATYYYALQHFLSGQTSRRHRRHERKANVRQLRHKDLSVFRYLYTTKSHVLTVQNYCNFIQNFSWVRHFFSKRGCNLIYFRGKILGNSILVQNTFRSRVQNIHNRKKTPINILWWLSSGGEIATTKCSFHFFFLCSIGIFYEAIKNLSLSLSCWRTI